MTKLINWGVSKNCSTFHCVFLKKNFMAFKKGALWLMRSIYVDCWHLLKRLIIVGVSSKNGHLKMFCGLKRRWNGSISVINGDQWGTDFSFISDDWVMWMNRINWIVDEIVAWNWIHNCLFFGKPDVFQSHRQRLVTRHDLALLWVTTRTSRNASFLPQKILLSCPLAHTLSKL